MAVVAIITLIVLFAGYMVANAMINKREQRELTRSRIFGEDGSILPAGAQTGSFGDDAANAIFGDTKQKSDFVRNADEKLRMLGINVEEAQTKLGRKLMSAGITNPNAVTIYLLFQRMVAPVLAVIGVLVVLRGHESFSGLLLNILMGGLLIVIGFFGPKLYVENLIQRRREQLQRGFPDTLDLLLVCVESGLALDAAFNRVCGELGRVHPEITKELNRTRIELSLLNNRGQALQNLAERTNMVSFRYLVAALIQSERFGTSLSDTLRVMADEYRTKRIVTAEEKAARIPVLMTIPLIFCLMPSFMLIILGPAIIAFMKSGFLQ